jgi:hypothetical protein
VLFSSRRELEALGPETCTERHGTPGNRLHEKGKAGSGSEEYNSVGLGKKIGASFSTEMGQSSSSSSSSSVLKVPTSITSTVRIIL